MISYTKLDKNIFLLYIYYTDRRSNKLLYIYV
jgi:hypothetical protein